MLVGSGHFLQLEGVAQGVVQHSSHQGSLGHCKSCRLMGISAGAAGAIFFCNPQVDLRYLDIFLHENKLITISAGDRKPVKSSLPVLFFGWTVFRLECREAAHVLCGDIFFLHKRQSDVIIPTVCYRCVM